MPSTTETLEPAAEEASFVSNRMREHGIPLGTAGPYHNVAEVRGPWMKGRDWRMKCRSGSCAPPDVVGYNAGEGKQSPSILAAITESGTLRQGVVNNSAQPGRARKVGAVDGVMAEVPEVEILVRGLREAVIGRRIRSADVLQSAGVRLPAVSEFSSLLEGRVVTGAQRRAKYILLSLSDDLMLAVHLMLWGTLALVPATQPRLPETLIIWRLDHDEDLRLLDKLGYARAAVAPPAILAERLDLDSLGPEALDPSFSVEVLARQLTRRRGVLKTVLLNQRVLAGLGNRDADESLWLAGIDPRRPAASLTRDELTRLHAAIGKVLAEGIALRGTQRDLFGRKGQAQHRRYIFERTGEPCPRCAAPVAYARIGGRNAHYCPQCQR